MSIRFLVVGRYEAHRPSTTGGTLNKRSTLSTPKRIKSAEMTGCKRFLSYFSINLDWSMPRALKKVASSASPENFPLLVSVLTPS